MLMNNSFYFYIFLCDVGSQDQLIREGVALYGTSGRAGKPDWLKIGKVAGLTNQQAVKRWRGTLSLSCAPRDWTEEVCQCRIL